MKRKINFIVLATMGALASGFGHTVCAASPKLQTSAADTKMAVAKPVGKADNIADDAALVRVRQHGLALLDEGKLDEAGGILSQVLEKNPQDGQATGGLGLVRLRQGRHAEAKELFDRALALDPANSSKWSSLASTAGFWKLIRESSAARDEKQPDIAGKKAREALLIDPDNAEGMALFGGILFDRGDLSGAEKKFREALKREPGNGSAIRGLTALLSKQGRRTEALALLDSLGGERSEGASNYSYIRVGILRDEADALVADGRAGDAIATLKHALSLSPENPWVRFDLARLYQKQGAAEQARKVMTDGRSIAPDDPQMLYASAFIVAVDQPGEALSLMEKIPPAVRTPSMLDLQQKLIARLRLQQEAVAQAEGRAVATVTRGHEGSVAAGIDFLEKSGTSGISSLKTVEWPVEARIPVNFGGYAFVHVDRVSARAGALPFNDMPALRQYGKIYALDFSGAASAGAPEQEADGTAVAAGYETETLRVDIGTTPLGFPVEDLVGGIRIRHSQDAFSYSLNLSRRPVASSLLSYAGARDPVSGEVWGGVRSTGADFRVGFDRGRLGVYANLGSHTLTGQNVMNNAQYELRAGADWELLGKDDMRLTAGLVATKWRYLENLRFYSFGHGGYYSPQSYESFAIPVRWSGRTGRWSYLLKGSVSASTSYEKDMPYYPAAPALQASGNPMYAGGNGSGTGFSLGTALEYQTTHHVFLGARVEIDRSEYYTPNFMTLYVRYMFDAHTDVVPYPPDPVKPYSRF